MLLPKAVVAALLTMSALAVAAPGDLFTSFSDFRIGATSLQTVQLKLGPVDAVRTGDAAESLTTLCYIVDGKVILFMAGEIDGPKLGGVQIATTSQRPPCAAWPRRVKKPQLKLGPLQLGMERAQVRSVLTDVIENPDGSYSVTFLSKKRMSRDQVRRLSPEERALIKRGELEAAYDVTVDVRVNFTTDKASTVSVWKSVTW